MDEMDAWSTFLTTGSVLDYLTYTSLKEGREMLNGTHQEAEDENQHDRSDFKGAEYW